MKKDAMGVLKNPTSISILFFSVVFVTLAIMIEEDPVCKVSSTDDYVLDDIHHVLNEMSIKNITAKTDDGSTLYFNIDIKYELSSIGDYVPLESFSQFDNDLYRGTNRTDYANKLFYDTIIDGIENLVYKHDSTEIIIGGQYKISNYLHNLLKKASGKYGFTINNVRVQLKK
jgi:hypothetical protein